METEHCANSSGAHAHCPSLSRASSLAFTATHRGQSGSCSAVSTALFTGYLLVNLYFFRFWYIFVKSYVFTRNEAQEQDSLLGTVFDYMFYVEPPGTHLYLSPQNQLHFAGRQVVGFLDCDIGVFLETQNKNIIKYCN